MGPLYPAVAGETTGRRDGRSRGRTTARMLQSVVDNATFLPHLSGRGICIPIVTKLECIRHLHVAL